MSDDQLFANTYASAGGDDTGHLIARLATTASQGTKVAPGEHRTFVVPDGYHLENQRPALEPLKPLAPRRVTGTVALHTPDALIDYVIEHNTSMQATVYADMPRLRLIAVLNDDHEGEPDWRDHRAVVDLRPTPEWEAWTKSDGRLMGQEDFSEFLEQHAHEVISPDAATMIEVARTFEAKRDVTFRRAISPQSGAVEVQYDETIDGRAGRGSITVPDEFTIVASPFYGAEPLQVRARFRYRLRDGHLGVGYSLLHVDRLMDDTFNDLVERLVERLVDELEVVPVLRGEPPAVRDDLGID